MTRASFKHRHQIAGSGAFAAITLDVQPSDIMRVRVAEDSSIARHYLDAAKTGIHYAYTQLILEDQQPPSADITIVELLESPCDTTELLVVYVAANAFCDAVGLPMRRPIEIDNVERRLSFPIG